MRLKSVRVTAVVGALTVGIVAASAELFTVSSNVPVSLTLPVEVKGDAELVAFVRMSRDADWQPASFTRAARRAVFALPPSSGTGDPILLLLNPPPGTDINDRVPPEIGQATIDGTLIAQDGPWQPEPLPAPPRKMSWPVRDAGNAVSRDSVQVALDGAVLDTVLTQPQDGGLVVVTARLPDLDYGKHNVVMSVADTAPSANWATWRGDFEVVDATNVIRLPDSGTVIAVDSHFPQYPSVIPLTDGVRELPGASAGNDVTWASAESDSPHWVKATFARPRRIHEVTVHWARANAASSRVNIQIPDGNDWRTVCESPVGGYTARQTMTFRFHAVETKEFRVHQPTGGGSASRPNLMWITEIEAR